jgi:hypothetical protein
MGTTGVGGGGPRLTIETTSMFRNSFHQNWYVSSGHAYHQWRPAKGLKYVGHRNNLTSLSDQCSRQLVWPGCELWWDYWFVIIPHATVSRTNFIKNIKRTPQHPTIRFRVPKDYTVQWLIFCRLSIVQIFIKTTFRWLDFVFLLTYPVGPDTWSKS